MARLSDKKEWVKNLGFELDSKIDINSSKRPGHIKKSQKIK
jgi:hypothetical protein